MIKVTFLDGKSKEFKKGISSLEIANEISSSLAKKCLVAKVNDCLVDLSAPIESDCSIEFITSESSNLEPLLNHSCAHLMACAILELYPEANFGVGPAIEEGYYYDFAISKSLNEEDLRLIEKKMKALAEGGHPILRRELSKVEALELFKNDKYKVELINELPVDEVISTYTIDNGKHSFTDLCRGPHVPNTKWLKNFKLLSISGAYWRGDAKRDQLQRIYGTCFVDQAALLNHLEILEERKKRDHRRLGKDLELFMLSEFGPGFPFWLPNGMILRRNLENFWYDLHVSEGYDLIQTPIMLNKELWEISGHWYNYRENMYTSTIDETDFAIKPMNCPGGLLVYKSKLHSYRDFPLRLGELGLVHRHEASGALNGLFRVRNFTQDDAHVFITENQIEAEIGRMIDLYDRVYSLFNLKYHIELSTRPLDKYIGEIATWDKAEAVLKATLENKGIAYKLNPGDGAFYGPKLDFKLKDSMNRIWQCGTIQLDMNLPERFDLTYVNEAGDKVRPIMLHRALFGSLERFIGILIEHFGGAFPMWLSPLQMIIIPVSNEHHLEGAKVLEKKLLSLNYRAKVDERSEKLNYKIRESQTQKIPYLIVVGDNEKSNDLVTYRLHGASESITVSLDEFLKLLDAENQKPRNC